MATAALPAPVPAPVAQVPRFGLLNDAAVDPDPTMRWEGGYEFAPEACSGAGVFDPCSINSRTPPERPALVTNTPFGVWAADECSALGMDEADYRARARRALEVQRSEQVAHEFWTGEQSASSAWGNQHLASPTSDVLGETMTPVDALACLEQGLGTYQGNRRGMIHCTIQTRTQWAAALVLRREGNLWLSPQDHIVVADAGYDGSGPDGQPAQSGNVWAYATGLVTVRLGPVDAYPGTLAEALNRLDNSVAFWAQQLASPSWDGCALVAASIDLDVCQTGGS